MIRIAVTGPESSGKTTLCESLASHFKVAYIPEFARTYLEKTKGSYQQVDLDEIAKGQLKNILAATSSIVISDSDFSVMEVWSLYKYGKVSPFIKALVKENTFDLHILCTPDIPWEDDPLRENPTTRDLLFEHYKKSLEKYAKHFITVSGSHHKRLEESIQSVALLLNK